MNFIDFFYLSFILANSSSLLSCGTKFRLNRDLQVMWQSVVRWIGGRERSPADLVDFGPPDCYQNTCVVQSR